MDRGFIKLDRKIFDWEWYSDERVKSVFIHLILKANYEDKMWQGILIKRGSFISSYEKLGAEIGLSRHQVITAINKLKKTNEVNTKANNKYTLFIVTNYDLYQDNFSLREHQREQLYEQQREHQMNTTKETKEDKNILDTIVSNPSNSNESDKSSLSAPTFEEVMEYASKNFSYLNREDVKDFYEYCLEKEWKTKYGNKFRWKKSLGKWKHEGSDEDYGWDEYPE